MSTEMGSERRRRTGGTIGLGVLLVSVAMGIAPVEAQSTAGTGMWARGGGVHYNVVGTGAVRQASVKADVRLDRRLLLEGTLSYRGVPAHREEGRTYVVPQLQVRLELPGRRVVPFVRGGGSVALPIADGAGDAAAVAIGTFSGVGVRVSLPGHRLGFGGEVRVIGEGTHPDPSTAELVTLLVWRF